jgi:hypothetical protein
MLLKRGNHFPLLRILNLSSLYNLTPNSSGYQFTNSSGDEYFVYFTDFYLVDSFIDAFHYTEKRMLEVSGVKKDD